MSLFIWERLQWPKERKKNSGYFLGEQQQEQFKIKITKDDLTLELKMKWKLQKQFVAGSL